MSNLKNKELSKLGYTNDVARSLVINTISKHFKHQSKETITQLLTNIKTTPQDYLSDDILGRIAATFIDDVQPCNFKAFNLLEQTGQLKIWGGKEIEHSAKKQMELAMSLPVTLQGALMPDAHTGYGLPIGGCWLQLQPLFHLPLAWISDAGWRLRSSTSQKVCSKVMVIK